MPIFRKGDQVAVVEHDGGGYFVEGYATIIDDSLGESLSMYIVRFVDGFEAMRYIIPDLDIQENPSEALKILNLTNN